LEIYAEEGDVKNTLQAAVKLTIYHNRWYNEMTVSNLMHFVFNVFTVVTHTIFQNPTHIALNLNKLIRKNGLQKTKNSLTSMNLTEPVLRLMNKYFENATTFKVDGYDF
jgi:hypothetical protein